MFSASVFADGFYGTVPVSPSANYTAYCLAATPTVTAGYFTAVGITSIVSVASGVGAVLTITQTDGVNNYVSKVDTSVAGTTNVTSCAVK